MDDIDGKMITGLRDASFSCYLTTPAEVSDFTAKLAEPESQHHQLNIKPSESEIGVFRAEKYFNMRLQDARRNPRIIDTITGKYVKEGDAIDLQRMRNKSQFVTTPISGVSSEASWSSQSALLKRTTSPPRIKRSFFFDGFSCRGSCSDKKSIQNINSSSLQGGKQAVEVALNAVKWEAVRKAQSSSSSSSSSRFQNNPTGIQGKKVPLVVQGRKSLEVFGSHSIKKEDNIAVDMERKLSVLTWDAIPKPIPQPQMETKKPTKANKSMEIMYDEMESDASSDLFEIEAASGSTRQAVVPRYEPSEASVEWSVVTASAAADFSFASSECGDNKMMSASQGKGRKYNGILSCKSHKAVEVAEAAQLQRR
ncbi:Protein PHYTOCHROME KINASE SUBSTRATE 3 [Linum perenne]